MTYEPRGRATRANALGARRRLPRLNLFVSSYRFFTSCSFRRARSFAAQRQEGNLNRKPRAPSPPASVATLFYGVVRGGHLATCVSGAVSDKDLDLGLHCRFTFCPSECWVPLYPRPEESSGTLYVQCRQKSRSLGERVALTRL